MFTVLGFLLTLGVLIVVHEYGHYRVARWCGVRVLRFSVGFGPVLWRRQRSHAHTEFTLSAVPLGGYVRMLDQREAPVPPHEQSQAFDTQPVWRRAAIVAAGPSVNLLLAVVLYAAAHLVGTQEPAPVLSSPAPGTLAAAAGLRPGDWVEAVSVPGSDEWRDIASLTELRWIVTQAVLDGEDLRLRLSEGSGVHRHEAVLALSTLEAGEVDDAVVRRIGLGPAFMPPVIGEPAADGPAARAGLREGDEVLSIDGQPVADTVALLERVRGYADASAGPMHWVVERGGSRLELAVQPRLVHDAGRRMGRIDAPVGGGARMVTVQLDPLAALTRGAQRTVEMATLSVRMLGRMVTGEASLRNLSGPLTIGDYAGQAIQRGPSYYLAFLAMVSVSLGVLNLLPLPMLDGGHLMYYLFEGVTGRPVSDLWHKWLQRGGAFLLLLMMTIALSNDVARLLGLQ
ncbi:RIP metalloprotease RseP [Ideonella sp.]|uniref:RIP metalloprotease RseP n=1 Tax=Ideonella sp. TaxID=1929293 RepID=UPI0035B29F56